MATRHVKLALVGYGKIAPKHLEVFRALGAEIAGACNRSEAGRARAREEGKIPQTYASIAEMLEREKPDAVLAMPQFSQNFRVASEIIPFGVPVLLEKPPGTSVEELHALDALAEKHATPVMIALNRRHYSVLARALEDAGGAERITGAFIEWSEDPRHVLQRMSKDEVARLIFGNTLHGLDLLATIAGPLEDPTIHARSLGEPFRWMMSLQGWSKRGALATFSSTWDAPGRWRVSFTVPDRRYVFAPIESCVVLEKGKDERAIAPAEVDQRFKPGFHEQARTFLDAVASGSVPVAHRLLSALPAMVLAEKLTLAVVAR